jgi:hypothetical protein
MKNTINTYIVARPYVILPLSLSMSENIWNTTGTNIYNTEAGSGYRLSVLFFPSSARCHDDMYYPIWY